MKTFRSEFHINQKSKLQIEIEIIITEFDKLIMLKNNDVIYKIIFFLKKKLFLFSFNFKFHFTTFFFHSMTTS